MMTETARARAFSLVDVFAPRRFNGNPLPVIVDADGLDGEAMMRITRWFNHSETTFLVPPEHADADYRVRIFTLERELPFAGHPTLGSCQVWLDQGGEPKAGEIVQECGAGLIRLQQQAGQLSFTAPPLLRSGPVDADTAVTVAEALQLGPEAIEAISWADNGPGWIAVRLGSAEAVLALEPLRHHEQRLEIGVVGPYPPGHRYAYEVRTFFSDAHGKLLEDPVTGSFNAAAAQWLLAEERVQAPYLAHQGLRLDRDGEIAIDRSGDTVWVGGAVRTVVNGSLYA